MLCRINSADVLISESRRIFKWLCWKSVKNVEEKSSSDDYRPSWRVFHGLQGVSGQVRKIRERCRNSNLAPKCSFCLLNCRCWFTVNIYQSLFEGSWSPAPRQLSHLEYSSKAPKTTEAILSGVIWTENHFFWKLSELKLVSAIWFCLQNSSLWCTCAPTWSWSRRERESQKGWTRWF